MSQTMTPMSTDELETLIRRVVREELSRLLRAPVRSILDDWQQEGPDDPAGDELLLKDALAVLQKYGDQSDVWVSWEEVAAELDQAEAMGELPD